jgi:hypothetical protein
MQLNGILAMNTWLKQKVFFYKSSEKEHGQGFTLLQKHFKASLWLTEI